MSWFKRQVEVRYVPSSPRYQALGSMEGELYFVDSDRGSIYSLKMDHNTLNYTLQHVCTVRTA